MEVVSMWCFKVKGRSSVEVTNEEEGNGYRDISALGIDVDLALFVEGDKPASVRGDHNEATFVKEMYLNVNVTFELDKNCTCSLETF